MIPYDEYGIIHLDAILLLRAARVAPIRTNVQHACLQDGVLPATLGAQSEPRGPAE